MAKIFLNYRRDDSDAWADRLFDRLVAHFPRENVFMDISGAIPVGFAWADWLDHEVSQCDIMLALIGRRWVAEFDARKGPDARDFVRVEIERALARRIPVVPILLGDTDMPARASLPESVRPLVDLQARRLDRLRFDDDAKGLAHDIERAVALHREWKSAHAPAGETAAAPEPTPPLAPPKPTSPLVRSREVELAASSAGTVFRDAMRSGREGPEMYVIPAGDFLMGSPEDELERRGSEGPQHHVTIARAFAMGRYAVTFEEFDRFCAAAGRAASPDEGWGRAQRPVINVSCEDAEAYCAWLSEETGADYRLPSEAEWEYAARAGTTSPFWWGASIKPEQANYNGNHVYAGGGEEGVYRTKTEPVDAFEPNPWSLHQVHGNIWEYCADAWNKNYQGAPTDGSVRTLGDASWAVVRGGSRNYQPRSLRSANRGRYRRTTRNDNVGFRLARTLGAR